MTDRENSSHTHITIETGKKAFHLGKEISRAIAKTTHFLYKNAMRPATIATAKGTYKTAEFVHNNALQPAAARLEKELDKPAPEMTRRRFLGLLTGATIVGGVGVAGANRFIEPIADFADKLDKDFDPNPLREKPENQNTGRIEDRVTPTSETKGENIAEAAEIESPNSLNLEETFPRVPIDKLKDLKPQEQPFYAKEANKIAEKLGWHAGSFFEFPPNVFEKLDAFKSKELLPVFPPRIYQWRDLIYKLSEEHNIPPNIIAIIMTSESGGKRNAGSSAGARGLFQVMPQHFKDRDISDRQSYIPSINGKIGMEVFTYFLNEARKKFGGKSDAYIYTRALMGYNGGTEPATHPAENPDFYKETNIYRDHSIRLMMTMQVAEGLRKQGMNNKKIISQISSPEIDARAAALSWFHNKHAEDQDNYPLYRKVYKQLGQPQVQPDPSLPDGIGQAIFDKYQARLKHTPFEGWQTSAGYEINCALGTSFGAIPQNEQEKAWREIETKRPVRKEGKEKIKKVIKYEQRDKQWDIDSTWDGNATCGPTTYSMVMSTYGDQITPTEMDRTFQKNKFRDPGFGSTRFRGSAEEGEEGYALGWLKNKGYEVVKIGDFLSKNPNEKDFDLEKAYDLINQGYLIMGSGLVDWIKFKDENGNLQPADHIFGINDIDMTDRAFKTFDPWEEKEVWRSEDDLARFFYAYAVRKKKTA